MQAGDGLQPVHTTGRKSPRRGSTCAPAAACKQGPAGVARGRLAGALMAYVLRARHGWDVANLTAGRDQAGG
jgi:hypothetical protein